MDRRLERRITPDRHRGRQRWERCSASWVTREMQIKPPADLPHQERPNSKGLTLPSWRGGRASADTKLLGSFYRAACWPSPAGPSSSPRRVPHRTGPACTRGSCFQSPGLETTQRSNNNGKMGKEMAVSSHNGIQWVCLV